MEKLNCHDLQVVGAKRNNGLALAKITDGKRDDKSGNDKNMIAPFKYEMLIEPAFEKWH